MNMIIHLVAGEEYPKRKESEYTWQRRWHQFEVYL
jgi:hypothetical protein